MPALIVKSSTFLLIILLGLILKKVGFLHRKNGDVIAKIVMNITLPCVFLASSTSLTINLVFMIYLLIGFIAHVLTLCVSYSLTRHHRPLQRGVMMIGCSGYDVGNFVLPFVSFMYPASLAYLASFNITNTMMSLGGDYACAAMVTGKHDFSLKAFIRELLSSVSFDVYLLMVLLAMLHLKLPDYLLQVSTTIASANAFLVMLMIGLKLELRFSGAAFKDGLFILGLRLICTAALTILILLLPIAGEARKVLILALFGPLVSVSSVYASRLGYEGDLIAQTTTISIVLSLLLIPCVMTLLG